MTPEQSPDYEIIKGYSLNIHPTSGVKVKQPPQNRYEQQDGRAMSYMAVLGQEIEEAARNAWTNDAPYINDPELVDTSEQVRNLLRPSLRKVIRHNEFINPIYQKLIELPEIGEIASISCKPLAIVFEKVDRIFPHAELMVKFGNLGSSIFDYDLIDEKFRYLAEASLVYSRLATEKHPFTHLRLVPNARFKNVAQIDGVLFSDIASEKIDLSNGWYHRYPVRPVEFKFDVRARYNSGTFPNVLDKRPHPRHVRELQEKLVKIIGIVDNTFPLPFEAEFVYFRGFLNHARHVVPFDKAFLLDWKMGLETSFRNNLIPAGRLREAAGIMLEKICERLKFLNNLSNKPHEFPALYPFSNLSQTTFRNVDTSLSPIKPKLTQPRKIKSKSPETQLDWEKNAPIDSSQPVGDSERVAEIGT